jgi:hypothetical protein
VWHQPALRWPGSRHQSGIYAMDELQRQHKEEEEEEEEEWGILLVDVSNAFNELDWTPMFTYVMDHPT